MQSCTCESVGLPTDRNPLWAPAIEYYEPRISQTEFVVLLEGKSEPVISCIGLCQAPCLVLKTRGVKVKRDSSARFKRCLPTPVGGQGGGGTAIVIWAILVCAAVKGMVFKQFTLG